tara:strand:- start:338 stop:700 length:363 start_codon:yes stop_codon:yes gene_type:complete
MTTDKRKKEIREAASVELAEKLQVLFAECAVDKKMTFEHMGATALYVATHLDSAGNKREDAHLIPQIDDVANLKNIADITAIVMYYILTNKDFRRLSGTRYKSAHVKAQQIAALLEKAFV